MIREGNRSRKTISVDSSLTSRTLESRITTSRDLRKYFRHLAFFSSYDTDIAKSSSILNIPVLSTVLPLAWITGADVYVDEVDRTFAESMDALQREYKKMYPGVPFKTRLIAGELVSNTYSSDKTALLFSGGLDSAYSLFSNMTLKPILVMIFGAADVPISNVSFQGTLEREYSDFSERDGLVIDFIRTNALEILDVRRVDHLFWRFQRRYQGGYWNGMGYSLGHIGQVAPLSIGRFSRLIVAGALDRTKAHDDRTKREYPDASYPSTDEKIMWSNMRVKHDASILRHQKASALKEFLIAHRLKLRPCGHASDLYSRKPQSPHLSALNCSQCPKCLRTIAELALAGVDPNECGFCADRSTFNRMRVLFQRKLLTRQDIVLWWRPLQQAVLNEVEGGLCGARQFFGWFKTMDLESSAGPYGSPLSDLYYRLPYPVADLLRTVWVELRSNLQAAH
jgi:hypothetical protein